MVVLHAPGAVDNDPAQAVDSAADALMPLSQSPVPEIKANPAAQPADTRVPYYMHCVIDNWLQLSVRYDSRHRAFQCPDVRAI
jgi:hypothetical protein